MAAFKLRWQPAIVNFGAPSRKELRKNKVDRHSTGQPRVLGERLRLAA